MKVSDNMLYFIKSFETFRSDAYICPAGFRTIGYGHLLSEVESITKITHDIALELLMKDISFAEAAVLRLTRIELRQNQFDALVSFVFNLGAGAYQRSTLRAKVNRGEHDSAPAEFLRWVYANGKILKGLIARRKAEAAVYLQDAAFNTNSRF